MASDPHPSPAQTNQESLLLPETSRETGPYPITPFFLHTADVLERISDGFVILDRAWRVVYANDVACRINQKPLEEFRGRTLWEEWPATVGTDVEHRYRRAMADQGEVHFEHRYLKEDREVWLAIDAYASEAGLDVFYRDITARKQSESELRTFQFLSENANDPFYLMDALGGFVYVNAAACRALGYPADRLRAMRVADIDPEYPGDESYHALFELAQRETLLPWEATHRRADGTVFPVEISASGLIVDGRPMLFASVRDITDRKRAEEERLEVTARQRVFLRDVLASVTDGHLILCDTPGDLPPPLTPSCDPIPLTQSSGLWELRQATQEACRAAGLSDERCYDLITAASEAGMNTIVHVGSGMSQVFRSEDSVQVRVIDQGAGIAFENLPRATLKKGYTTAGTLGQGMKMMLQMADKVFLLTGAQGTIVVMEQGRVAPESD